MQETHKISKEPISLGWEIPKSDNEYTSLTGYTRGPISLGSVVGDVLWEYSYENFSVMLRRDISTIKTSIYNMENLEEVSVAFDEKGKYILAYRKETGESFIVDGETTVQLAGFIATPKVVYSKSLGIVVYYIKNGKELCFRSRDSKFTKEFTMGNTGEATIKRVGVDMSNRIRFLLEVAE